MEHSSGRNTVRLDSVNRISDRLLQVPTALPLCHHALLPASTLLEPTSSPQVIITPTKVMYGREQGWTLLSDGCPDCGVSCKTCF